MALAAQPMNAPRVPLTVTAARMTTARARRACYRLLTRANNLRSTRSRKRCDSTRPGRRPPQAASDRRRHARPATAVLRAQDVLLDRLPSRGDTHAVRGRAGAEATPTSSSHSSRASKTRLANSVSVSSLTRSSASRSRSKARSPSHVYVTSRRSSTDLRKSVSALREMADANSTDVQVKSRCGAGSSGHGATCDVPLLTAVPRCGVH